MPTASTASLSHIRTAGVVAIIRGDYGVDHLLQIGAVLVEHGITTMEITLNSRDALAAITALRSQLGAAILVGAGTVRTAQQVDAAVDAGAQFLVAPCLDIPSLKRAQQHDILHLPGVFTGTEVQQAVAAGAQLLKLFPMELGGPHYLKALRAPFDDVDFVPTGGVGAANIAEYVKAGAAAVAVGSALVAGAGQSLEQLAARAAALRAAWQEAHNGAS